MLVCVVFVVLLAASALASMRWLLCGGDDSTKTKTKSVITKKIHREDFFTITVLIHSKKIDPHQITNVTVFLFKKIKSATRIYVKVSRDGILNSVK